MAFVPRFSARALLAASIAGTAMLTVGSAWASSGGAAIAPNPGGLAPNGRSQAGIPPPPSKHTRGRWLRGVKITEYWPAPESWFGGQLVTAPGLSGKHRIDWLYSAMGTSMEGDGIGLDGRMYHIRHMGDGGWVTAAGVATSPNDGWSAGPPFWRAGGYWRNVHGAVTFPLQRGGWYAGLGVAYVPLRGITFAVGPSLPLRFYRSIAVDPRVIPLGSRVYIPAYRHDGYGGWFIAQDTGGAIIGRHVDVYRSPPRRGDGGRTLSQQRVFVIRSRS